MVASCGEAERAFSSNPYDCAQGNPAYEAIVARGAEILPDLQAHLAAAEADGLEEYLLALAIEEIAGLDLKARPETAWATASEFWTIWTSGIMAGVFDAPGQELPPRRRTLI